MLRRRRSLDERKIGTIKNSNTVEDKLYKAFSGSEIEVILLQGALEDNGISSIYRDGSKTGVSPFYGGTPEVIDLYVNEADLEKVNLIVEEFIRNRDSDKEEE